MRWVDALKLYNQGKGGWCIPRKGTKEYDEVRKIMGVKAEKGLRKEDKPKHLKEDVLAQLRKVAEDAKHRNADKAKKLLAMMEEKKKGTTAFTASEEAEGNKSVDEYMAKRQKLIDAIKKGKQIYENARRENPVGKMSAKNHKDIDEQDKVILGLKKGFSKSVFQGLLYKYDPNSKLVD